MEKFRSSDELDSTQAARNRNEGDSPITTREELWKEKLSDNPLLRALARNKEATSKL